MNDAVSKESVGGGADTAKLVAAILLVVAGIAAYYVLQAQSEWLRWLAVLAGIVLAIVVFGTSPRGKSLWSFFLDSRAELRKVVWPTRTETRNITLAVFAFVAILGAFFWLLDLLLSYVVKLLGQGS